jgi:hypothetical protein
MYIGCDLAGGVNCQDAHNIKVRSLDTRTKNRYAARDDVGHYTLRNLPAVLLKPVYNPWNCHLHTERGNTSVQHVDGE